MYVRFYNIDCFTKRIYYKLVIMCFMLEVILLLTCTVRRHPIAYAIRIIIGDVLLEIIYKFLRLSYYMMSLHCCVTSLLTNELRNFA